MVDDEINHIYTLSFVCKDHALIVRLLMYSICSGSVHVHYNFIKHTIERWIRQKGTPWNKDNTSITSNFLLKPHSLFIFYFIVRASAALGVIIVACLSISGHTHNSLSCNLVSKQLTFFNYLQTNDEYGYLHFSDRGERGREDRVNWLIRQEPNHC